MRAFLLPALAAWVALPLMSSPAHAEGVGDAERARVLFEEGRSALSEGKVREACDKFAEAKTLAPEACGVLQNLAMCREQQARDVAAYDDYGALLACANKANQTERIKLAEDKRTMLRARLAEISFSMPASSRADDYAVRVDGRLVSLHDGVRLTEPGTHRVEVERAGCILYREDVALRAGRNSVHVPANECSEKQPAPASATLGTDTPSAEPSTSATRSGMSTTQALGVVSLGTAAAAGIAGASVFVVALATEHKTDAAGNEQSTPKADIATALGVTAGVLGVTGVVLLLVGRPSSKTVSTITAPFTGGLKF